MMRVIEKLEKYDMKVKCYLVFISLLDFIFGGSSINYCFIMIFLGMLNKIVYLWF